MIDTEGSRSCEPVKSAVLLTASIVAAILVTGTIIFAGTRVAQAKPEFAAQTGLPCGQCHVNPAGGGKLKPFGEKFKENGFKVKK